MTRAWLTTAAAAAASIALLALGRHLNRGGTR